VSATVDAARRRAVLPRLASFVAVRFAPPVYVSYGVLWAPSLEAAVSALGGTAWRPSWGSALRAVSLVFALLFMRMLDEQKDLAYDRRHNPGRPLVTGAVTAGELRAAMVALAVVGTAANGVVSTASALVYLAALGYGLLLAAVERASPRLAESLIPNLFVVYPVQVLVSVYLVVSVGARVSWGLVAVLVAYAGAFLHFEFARKTSRRSRKGERLYSELLGPGGSAAVAVGCALVGCLGLLVVCLPHGGAAWLVCLAALPAGWGAVCFLIRQNESWPVRPAMAVVVAVHSVLIVVGATA